MNFYYQVYLAIRQGFPLSRMITYNLVLWNFAIIQVLPFRNNPKDLDPSDKMDLDFFLIGIIPFCIVKVCLCKPSYQTSASVLNNEPSY